MGGGCHYVIGRDWPPLTTACLHVMALAPGPYAEPVATSVAMNTGSPTRYVFGRLPCRASQTWLVVSDHSIQCVTAPYFNSPAPSTHPHTHTHTRVTTEFLLSPYSLPSWLLSLRTVLGQEIENNAGLIIDSHPPLLPPRVSFKNYIFSRQISARKHVASF